jgi:MGT family glycosyltransferase
VLLDPEPGEQPPSWLTARPERPLVYATSGTLAGPASADRLAAIIAGVRDLDVTLVATLGRRLDPARFGPQPGNVHLAGYVSQALLLPHCAVVVAHGGFGTVLGALVAGVPLVLLPGGADQPVNARRCAALGVAKVIGPDQCTPEAIRAATLQVLQSPRYRLAAKRLREEIEALPGPDYAVRLIEQIVAEQTP